ncbi:MAG: GNAT family N-acetyltransferase [Sphingomonas sp.]|nr:GNAT family N-acetyltransferase [Sphingomonas sp.]
MSDYLAPPDLIESFARGWARTRRAAPPHAVGSALCIETAQPTETRRYIFARPPDGIAAIAATITEPMVLLKAAIDPVQMAALLPPAWHVEQTGTTMTADFLPVASGPVPDGLWLAGDWDDDVFVARLCDAHGQEAARGRMTPIDGWALHDRIIVAEEYRRRGLGTLIMAVLGAEANRQGVRRGLLNATVAGRALYQRLGWLSRAPWTTAQIVD